MDSLCVDFSNQIQVKIMSKKLIKPSSPTPNHLQNYKLSFFDQIAEQTHMPFVLFYPKNNSKITTNTMVQQLEQSLSRILTHVYPAAGRFDENKSSIICHDQGVTLIKAKVNRRMDDEFLQQAHNNLDFVMEFWPQGTKEVNASNLFMTPVMFVQITIFQCGGIALSTSTAHPAIDGWTNFTFIYEWSKVCKLEIPAEKIDFMSFDLAKIFRPRDNMTFSDQAKPLEAELVAKNQIIDEVSLSKLREKLTNSGALRFTPSRVEMVTAILWRAQLRASQAITGEMKRSVMSFPLNLRGKLKNYREATNPFGNFIIDIPITYEPKGTTNMELQDFITIIRETMQKTLDYCSEASSPNEVIEMVANLYNKYYEGKQWGANEDVEEFTCSSLTRFHMQEANFGWGNPSLMHFGSRNNQVFWLYSTQCGNSIAVQMDLKEKYMDFIQHDQEFLAFTKV